MTSDYQGLLRRLLGGGIVAYYGGLSPYVNGVKNAVLLSQLLYLDSSLKTPGSWFQASVLKIQKATGLSTKEQQTARAALVKLSVIEAKRKSVPARYFYRVSLDHLVALVSGQFELPAAGSQIVPTGDSSVSQRATLDSPNPPPKSVPSGDSVKKVKRKKGNAVSKSRPPSIELMKRILHRYPHKSTWDSVDRVVGSAFGALLRWGRVLRLWRLKGWNPTNTKDMLDRFRNSLPEGDADRADYDAGDDLRKFKKERGMK
ncbi:MAG: hypothetical protein KAJ01_02020 [Candidatus Hydrogenedentes bacterium]|nr:hypothetical protein [Candidatus Hydrogenedentota bacterium]